MTEYDIFYDEKKHRYVFDYDGIDSTGLVYLCTTSLQDIKDEIRMRCNEGRMSFKFEDLEIDQLRDIFDIFQKSQALLDAVAKGNELETARLLKDGADPNFQATDGKSALMIAARYGYESRFGVVELLVQAGACLDSRDGYGLTALDYANEVQSDESWHSNIANFLREHNKSEFEELKTRRLNVTIVCQAVYNSSIDVPINLSLEDALKYAKDHIQDIPLGVLEYIPDSDELDIENCDFDDLGLEEGIENVFAQAKMSSLDQQIQSASGRTVSSYTFSSEKGKTSAPEITSNSNKEGPSL